MHGSRPIHAHWLGLANEDLRDGELILICDIGGGTTDFSLVRARLVNGELQFERTAIGEHLLLGGDNLDFALARHVEKKLKDIKLTLRQRYALRRACCAAKERLLSDSPLERVPVTVLGSGSAVVGQALSTDLTREEVLQILTAGFLPITAPDDMPAPGRPTGLRELGLPYASDPAITKHLAAFLTQAAVAMNGSSANPRLVSTRCRALQWRLLCAGCDSREDCRGNFQPGSAEPKAAGGPSSSTTKLLILRLLGVLLTTAAYGAAPVCASEPAARAPTTSGCARTRSAGHLCFACRGRRGHHTSATQPRILGAG
jgi:hypothetical protein